MVKEKNVLIEKKNMKRKKMDEETKQLIIILTGISLVFLLIFGVYFGIQMSHRFEYLSIKWTIENAAKAGATKILFYHTAFSKVYNGEYYGTHDLYLRNDPRKNNISVDINSLSFAKNYIVTSDPSLRKCSDSNLAFYALGEITLALPFIKNVSDGSTDISNVPERQVYADCSNASSSMTVVKIELGNETRIYADVENEDCYIIEISDCSEILKASEKFVTNIVKELKFGQG